MRGRWVEVKGILAVRQREAKGILITLRVQLVDFSYCLPPLGGAHEGLRARKEPIGEEAVHAPHCK